MRNREIQNIIDEGSTEFACSHFAVHMVQSRGESFEKEVLMLSSTDHVFPWNKYCDHLKNFILLITDSVSMQAIYFFLSFFFQKDHLPNEGCVQANFWQDLHSGFFKKHYFPFSAVRANENFSNMKHHNFFEYHLKLSKAVCSCFSKSLIKMKKLTWIYIFTLVIGPSKSFMEAITPLIKLVETPQWSLKIKNEVNFFFPSRIGVRRVKYSSF